MFSLCQANKISAIVIEKTKQQNCFLFNELCDTYRVDFAVSAKKLQRIQVIEKAQTDCGQKHLNSGIILKTFRHGT